MTHPVRIVLDRLGREASNKSLEMVSELQKSGLVMDRDFVWIYQKSSYEDNEFLPASVTFEFQDAALATFYQLKWSKP